MSFVFKKTDNGTTPVIEEYLQSNVSITKGQLLDFAAGYASNASPTAHVTSGLIGVADETKDNSGGSAGDVSIAIQVNPAALYIIDTVGTPTQAQMGTSVLTSTAATITESSALTDETAVVRMLKLVSATNKKILGKLNFATPGTE